MKVQPIKKGQATILTTGQVAFIDAVDKTIADALSQGVAMPKIIAGLDMARAARISQSIRTMIQHAAEQAQSKVLLATPGEAAAVARRGNGA